MGTADRIIRGVAGVAAVVGALLVGATSVVGIVLWVVAAVLLVTAAVGFCPVYAALHVDTLGRRSTHV
jgi:hypothetical protein